MERSALLATLVVCVAFVPARAHATPRPVDFGKDILPILEASCFSCHGAEKGSGQLRLHTRTLAMKGGVSGPAIVPGKSAESLLWKLLVAADEEDRMPRKAAPLPKAKIDVIRAWIDAGAVWPDALAGPEAKIERHWAYIKPARSALPKVARPAWVRNPVDAFVLARLEKEGLAPSPEASRPTLIRRLTLDLVGLPPAPAGSFANNCLLARRLVERGGRSVQLFHRGWDHHGAKREEDLVTGLSRLCRETDRAAAALIKDLKQRGLLDSTLVVWGGEFGRTPMNEERSGSKFLGRDHNPKAFTMWMAGGGIKPGVVVGKTDEFGYTVVEDPVHVHDLHATVLHQMGIDHTKLTFRFQGRDYRLTDVAGHVVKKLVA